jgi:outer membrane protein assembly factor BamA
VKPFTPRSRACRGTRGARPPFTPSLSRGALFIALLLTTFAHAQDTWPKQIDRIEIHGNRWTMERVVKRELAFTAPGLVTEEQWKLSFARLWNTGVFSEVQLLIENRGGEIVAVVGLEERITLNPLLSFGVGGGTWWFRVGACDMNFLGTYLEWGARYERFDIFNGAQAWFRDPRLFGLRLDGLAQFDFLIRPRPQYVRRRLSGTIHLAGELSEQTLLYGNVQVYRDEYFAPKEGEAALPQNLIAGQGALGLTLGRVDNIRLLQKGWTVNTRATLAITDDPNMPVVTQLFMELFWFVPFGDRLVFSLRGQAGLSSLAPAELQFYLGGLDLVRGYEDSVVRTHRYALLNLELRAILFDSSWFALGAAVFADAAIAEEEGLKPLLSVGGGIRLLVPRFVRTGIRADFALTLAGQIAPGVSLGVYQFF